MVRDPPDPHMSARPGLTTDVMIRYIRVRLAGKEKRPNPWARYPAARLHRRSTRYPRVVRTRHRHGRPDGRACAEATRRWRGAQGTAGVQTYHKTQPALHQAVDQPRSPQAVSAADRDSTCRRGTPYDPSDPKTPAASPPPPSPADSPGRGGRSRITAGPGNVPKTPAPPWPTRRSASPFYIPENTTVKHTKSKSRRGLVAKRIVYRNRRRPHDRPQELKIDVRRDETVDTCDAAAMVAVRTSIPMSNVKIIEIVGLER